MADNKDDKNLGARAVVMDSVQTVTGGKGPMPVMMPVPRSWPNNLEAGNLHDLRPGPSSRFELIADRKRRNELETAMGLPERKGIDAAADEEDRTVYGDKVHRAGGVEHSTFERNVTAGADDKPIPGAKATFNVYVASRDLTGKGLLAKRVSVMEVFEQTGTGTADVKQTVLQKHGTHGPVLSIKVVSGKEETEVFAAPGINGSLLVMTTDKNGKTTQKTYTADELTKRGAEVRLERQGAPMGLTPPPTGINKGPAQTPPAP